MKHTIDLWGKDFSDDHRWDTDRNASLLNIVFNGGAFGNFLRFILDKFSKLSPDLPGDPFTDIGTSHLKSVKFSGLIQRYHSSFINDNKDKTQLPVCLILPTTQKHHLYLKIAQWFRTNDQKVKPDDLWYIPIGELSDALQDSAKHIIELYQIKSKSHFDKIPKFIVRDWFKLEFLQNIEQTHDYLWFDKLKKHEFFKFQKTFYLDLETFFKWSAFIENIKKLDRFFGLELDFDRSDEMKDIFDQGLILDNFRQECNMIDDVCENDLDASLTGLDVCMEAYIYAEFEKRNPNIQMPLTNRFFRDTEEIRQFLDHFPNWYRRPNPNLPRK